ncbi:DnaJ domain-containing protein [Legionella sp. W05-934-2]|uniref:DnaJ domain-containing protein n=1 Tax=Legionella sp. W05-934-2 TaxID=1198649 RepID=UPI0034637559
MRSLLDKLNDLENVVSDAEKEIALKRLMDEASKQTYYDVMGFTMDEAIDKNRLKKTYRSLAMKLHPDKNKDKCYTPICENLFKLVSDANSTLSDPMKEKDYRLSQKQGNHASTSSAAYQNHASYTAPNSSYSPPYGPYTSPYANNDFGDLFAEFFSQFKQSDNHSYSQSGFGVFQESDFDGFPSHRFSPFSNVRFVFSQNDGFDSFSSSSFVFMQRASFGNEYPYATPRASSQKPVIISNFEQFMSLLENKRSMAHRLFISQPNEVVSLCQTFDQFMLLRHTDQAFAHHFFEVNPNKFINLLQTRIQFLQLLDENNKIAHDFFLYRPDKIIGLFRTPEQFMGIVSRDKQLAYDMYRRQPDRILGFFQTFDAYMLLLIDDRTLANSLLVNHPAPIIGLIQYKEQFNQLKEWSPALASYIVNLVPNFAHSLASSSSRPNRQANNHSPRQPHAPRFFNRTRDSEENSDKQTNSNANFHWNIFDKLKSFTSDALPYFLGALGAIGLISLARRSQQNDNIRTSRQSF